VEMPTERAALLALVEAGKWLGPVAVACVLGVHRNTVHNMLERGQLDWRLHPGGKNRQIDPGSVLRQLRISEQVYTGNG